MAATGLIWGCTVVGGREPPPGPPCITKEAGERKLMPVGYTGQFSAGWFTVAGTGVPVLGRGLTEPLCQRPVSGCAFCSCYSVESAAAPFRKFGDLSQP